MRNNFRRTTLTATVVLSIVTVTGVQSAVDTAHAAPSAPACPALQVIVVNGTTESNPGADPNQDTGFQAQVVVPALAQANTGGKTVVARSYVPYDASFGGKPGDASGTPYDGSVANGQANATKMITDDASRCPNTQFFLSGYSQGAQVMSQIARAIGAGSGPIPAERLAGVSLFSDPTRGGGPVFADGRTSPGEPPGASGDAVSQVQLGAVPTPAGQGIEPNAAGVDFGSVADRVASFCTPGDMACDTPKDANLAHLVANIASQTHNQDPVSILTSVASALGQSILYTGADVINNNIDYDQGSGTFSVHTADSTVLQRAAAYADPMNAGAGQNQVFQAISKIAGMGLGLAVTVAQNLLAPDAIAEIAAAGLANPVAALGVIGTRLAGLALQLFPPATTINSLVNVAFDEISKDVSDNLGLAHLASATDAWQTVAKHGSYGSTPVGASGATPSQFVTAWIVAAAHDLAGSPAPAPTVAPGPGPLLASPDQSVLTADQILGTSHPTATTSTDASATPTPGTSTSATAAPTTERAGQ